MEFCLSGDETYRDEKRAQGAEKQPPNLRVGTRETPSARGPSRGDVFLRKPRLNFGALIVLQAKVHYGLWSQFTNCYGHQGRAA